MKSARVEFSGTGTGFLGFLFVRFLLIVVTLGLYLFFFNAAKRAWKYQHTKFDGQGMEYELRLWDWLKHAIVGWLLIAITFGLFTPWAIARSKAYAMSHSRLADGRRFRFKGTGGEVIFLFILSVVLLPISFGFAMPWILAMWKQWEWRNTELSTTACDSVEAAAAWTGLGFDGSGSGLAFTFIWNYLLSLVTFGLYSPWAAVNVMSWEARSVTTG